MSGPLYPNRKKTNGIAYETIGFHIEPYVPQLSKNAPEPPELARNGTYAIDERILSPAMHALLESAKHRMRAKGHHLHSQVFTHWSNLEADYLVLSCTTCSRETLIKRSAETSSYVTVGDGVWLKCQRKKSRRFPRTSKAPALKGALTSAAECKHLVR